VLSSPRLPLPYHVTRSSTDRARPGEAGTGRCSRLGVLMRCCHMASRVDVSRQSPALRAALLQGGRGPIRRRNRQRIHTPAMPREHSSAARAANHRRLWRNNAMRAALHTMGGGVWHRRARGGRTAEEECRWGEVVACERVMPGRTAPPLATCLFPRCAISSPDDDALSPAPKLRPAASARVGAIGLACGGAASRLSVCGRHVPSDACQ